MTLRPLPTFALLFIATGCASTRPQAAVPEPIAERAAGDLRVMTFNIQSAAHGLDAVAEVIQSAAPDVVALQEVDRATRRSRGLNQAEELSRRTDLPHRAHFAATQLAGGDYGVAILSRHPIVQAKNYRLPTPRGLEPRTVAHVVLQVGQSEVSVYVTHLTNLPRRAAIRLAEVRAIARLLAIDPRPKLVMGDFNDAEDSAAVLALRRYAMDVFSRCGVGPSETYPLPLLPDLRLDYVLASNDFVARRAFVLRKLASDHFPLVADLQLAPQVAEGPSTAGATAGR